MVNQQLGAAFAAASQSCEAAKHQSLGRIAELQDVVTVKCGEISIHCEQGIRSLVEVERASFSAPTVARRSMDTIAAEQPGDMPPSLNAPPVPQSQPPASFKFQMSSSLATFDTADLVAQVGSVMSSSMGSCSCSCSCSC